MKLGINCNLAVVIIALAIVGVIMWALYITKDSNTLWFLLILYFLGCSQAEGTKE